MSTPAVNCPHARGASPKAWKLRASSSFAKYSRLAIRIVYQVAKNLSIGFLGLIPLEETLLMPFG
jgi:hypothetical protein